MEKVKEVQRFLEDAKVFYVSTFDGNKPRVRPFSGIHEFEGKLYMPTSNKKKVFAQMMENPNVEISGMAHGKWIHIEAEIVCDKRIEARKSMLKTSKNQKSRLLKIKNQDFQKLVLRF